MASSRRRRAWSPPPRARSWRRPSGGADGPSPRARRSVRSSGSTGSSSRSPRRTRRRSARPRRSTSSPPRSAPRGGGAARKAGAVDLSLRVGALGRFRVNLHRTRRGTAAAIRVLPRRIPALSELGLPESLYELTPRRARLVLVTGATGSGKSTTLAALVDRINRTERRHVVTIEDPVEYEHAHGTCDRRADRGRQRRPELLRGARRGAPPGPRRDPRRRDARPRDDARGADGRRDGAPRPRDAPHERRPADREPDHSTSSPPSSRRPGAAAALARPLGRSSASSSSRAPTGRGASWRRRSSLATDSVRAHIRRGSFHQLHTELTLGRRLRDDDDGGLSRPAREGGGDHRGRGAAEGRARRRSRGAAPVARLTRRRGRSRGRAWSGRRGPRRPPSRRSRSPRW